MTPQVTLNETALAEYGIPYVGTQQLWGMFFDYASYTSVMVWMGLFGYPLIKNILQKAKARRSSRGKLAVNEQYDDRLNLLMRAYKEVPVSWFILLFLAAFIPILVIVACGHLYIPLWTYFIALATGVVVVIVRFPPFYDCIILTCLDSL
jgi:hypothetical protein